MRRSIVAVSIVLLVAVSPIPGGSAERFRQVAQTQGIEGRFTAARPLGVPMSHPPPAVPISSALIEVREVPAEGETYLATVKQVCCLTGLVQLPPDSPVCRWRLAATASTDVNGTFLVRLAPGRYVVLNNEARSLSLLSPSIIEQRHTGSVGFVIKVQREELTEVEFQKGRIVP